MGNFFNKVRSYVSNHKGLVIIVVAALLLELISAVQYYYSHNMMEAQLSKRAESELRMKSIIIKGMLNVMENTLLTSGID